MTEPMKREDVAIIYKKLDEAKRYLKRQNVYSCLHCFQEVLEKTLHTRMLPADQKQLNNDINTFQQNLAAAKAFKEMYGPVTFHDDDAKTALDFLKQILVVEDEEISSQLEESIRHDIDAAASKNGGSASDQEILVQKAKELIDSGAFAKAKAMLGEDSELNYLILQLCNTKGIAYRKAGNIDGAIAEFRKALVFHPEDEGLYYNIARAYLERKEWQDAEDAILQAVEINPEFAEGKALLSFVRKQHAEG
ncbi:MAG: tetratricopeptide repeat protein [Syntrophus sp. (in: bacteria)]